jgi:hypothetical protein
MSAKVFFGGDLHPCLPSYPPQFPSPPWRQFVFTDLRRINAFFAHHCFSFDSF